MWPLRTWNPHFYRAVGTGTGFEHFPFEWPVFYSASRPWLSSLEPPDEHPLRRQLSFMLILFSFVPE